MTRVLLAVAALAALGAAPRPAAALEYRTGITATGGLLVTSQLNARTRDADPFLLLALEGRHVLGPGLAVEFWAMDGRALTPIGSRSGQSYGLRAGVAFEHVTALVGGYLNLVPGAPSESGLLPSATVVFGSRTLRGVFGLFDRYGVAPLRLGVEFENFGLAYLPGLGVEATAKFAFDDALALETRLLAFQLVTYGVLNATVGLSWTPGVAR
jgi:hypothetical protein